MIPLSAFVVIITESRAGIILAVIAFALSLAFSKSVRISKWVVSSIVGALVLVVGYNVILSEFPSVAERLRTVGDTISVVFHSQTSDSSSGAEDFKRKIELLYTIDQVKRVPIFGIGYGAFGVAIGRATGTVVQAHSFFGTFFVELGLIGFLLFVAFNMSLAAALVRRVNDLRRPKRRGSLGWHSSG